MKQHLSRVGIVVVQLVAATSLAANAHRAPAQGSEMKRLAAAEKNVEVRIMLNDLDGDLRSAEEYAKSAMSTEVEQYRRARYKGSMDRLSEGRAKLGQIERLAGPTYPSLLAARALFEETRSRVLTEVASLRTVYLQDVKAPPDIYKGGDRASIESAIRSAWNNAWPKDEILAIRFHAASWERQKDRIWNEASRSWQDRDVSALPVTVIVRSDERTATKYVAFMNKDNVSGQLSPGVHTKAGGYVVEEMLIANLSK